MKTLLLSSLVFVFLIGILCLPSASALPVSYNTTSINLGLTSVPRNSSSYDVFPLIPDNWLWEKFDNNTIDSGPLSVPATITYNTNLKALYKFENTITDSSSSARTLTKAAGTQTFTTSGEEGSAISLDGSTYYTASDASLPTGTNPVSISSWIYIGSLSGNPIPYGYGTGGGTTMNYFFEASGFLDFSNVSTSTRISNTAFSINTWYYLTITYDGTNARVYINGSLDKTTAITVNTSLLGATGLSIGATNTGTNKFTGKIDEWRIYNTALTLQQHQALYMVGHYSQSHTFDGGEKVSMSTLSAPVGTNDRTISFWIKAPTPTSTEGIFGYGIGGSANQAVIVDVLTTNQIQFAGWANDVVSTGSITPNVWNYVALVVSNTGTVRTFYINGVLDKTATTTALNTDTTNPITIGSDALTGFVGNTPLIGQIDNFKVYPYALSSSQITSDYNSISPISSGKQFMSYYHGISGSSTLTNKIGYGATTTLLCNLNTVTPTVVSNGSNIYYECTNAVKKFDLVQNTNSHVYTSTDANAANARALFMGIKHIFSASSDGSGFNFQLNSEKGNVTQGGTSGTWVTSNQQINVGTVATTVIKFYDNATTVRTLSSVASLCNINFSPTNVTKALDSIACDQAVPAMAIKYWNGMNIQKIGGYSTNTTQQFLSSVDASPYKKLLTLPCALYGAEAPCITFILTDQTQTDYLVVLTSAHVYYGKAQTALGKLNNNNYGFQSYDIITQGTSSSYEIQNPILQSMKLYGPINLNSTVSKAGLFTLPSGYTVKTTSIESAIRTIDPRWTNDATDIPIITSTSSLFPIFLTVSNAPVFSAIKVTNPYQLINSEEAVWAVAQLDSTRTVEFDLPSNVCVNVYVADISVSPSIWNFQGIICASGVNQKTISYTNTLPFTFWTYPWGASDSFTPNTNGLVTTVRHTTAPFSYNIVLKNSTGTVFQNTTYTSNSTIDTQSFNLTGRAKPVSLYISSVTGGVNQIYSAFLGSPISLASTASFFNQYFSYQGFNLLAFIPIIFASMFTRNTIGIGVVLTVLCIATLSWLSVVVIPELDIMIMIVIAIIGLIAYRLTYY